MRTRVVRSHSSPVQIKIPHRGQFQSLLKQLHVRLPSPRQKYLQFLQIPPFNRLPTHIGLIEYFLSKLKFFNMHPPSMLTDFAHKVVCIDCHSPVQLLQSNPQIQSLLKMVVVVESGEVYYKGKRIGVGCVVTRDHLEEKELSQSANARLLGIPRHQYLTSVSNHTFAVRKELSTFLSSIQTLKIFSQKTLSKFVSGLTMHYYLQKEHVFEAGHPAESLLLVYKGKVARKVVVEIDKINRIPYMQQKKLLRIMCQSYEHQIDFDVGDLVGVGEIIDNIPKRKEAIEVLQDSVILAIERNSIEAVMDQYIKDRLKKYNMKKYPLNYDQLCANYTAAREEKRKVQERKIDAMLRHTNYKQSNRNVKTILDMYKDNIKQGELKNLLSKRLSFLFVDAQ